MRRITITRPGGHEQLQLEHTSDPTPGPEDVVIDTRAIGVNYADCAVRMGLYASAEKYVGWPITPGFEFAGRVRETGTHVSDLEPGQAVFGLSRFGAYASCVCVPRRQVFPLPPSLNQLEGGTFLVAFLTAWYALFECGALAPGKKVLVHSAAGGVGGAALQLARAAGAYVIGVVGAPHKLETARALGADVVIDKSRSKLWQQVALAAPEGLDIVLDPNGIETLQASYNHLRPTGRLIVYGFHTMLRRGAARANWPQLALNYLRTPRFNPLRMTNDNKSVLAFNLSYLFDEQSALERGVAYLSEQLEEGCIRPLPVASLPLADVASAHRTLESGASTGKLALIP